MVDTPKTAADLAPQFHDGTVAKSKPDAAPARAVRIEIDGDGFGRFKVGGEEVGALINEITITCRVGQKTSVVWGDVRTDLQIEIGSPLLAEVADGYRFVRLNEAHRNALISLGWTPPAEEA